MIKAFANVVNHPLNKRRRLQALATALWWKCNQLFFHLPAIVKITDEFSIICHPESSFGSYIVYARWPEYEETHFLLKYLKPSDTYVDIGAHVGPELLAAASKVTRGRLYGFEPTPETYAELVKNIKLNNLETKMQVFSEAVSNKNGFARFITEGSSEMFHLSNNKKRGKGVKVKTITLDSFTSKRSIKKINVLKVDTEGAELNVFKGAQRLFDKKRIEIILFEVNKQIEDYGSTIRELLVFLEQHNMQLFGFNNDKLKRITAKKFKYTKTTNLVAALKTAHVKKRLRAL